MLQQFGTADMLASKSMVYGAERKGGQAVVKVMGPDQELSSPGPQIAFTNTSYDVFAVNNAKLTPSVPSLSAIVVPVPCVYPSKPYSTSHSSAVPFSVQVMSALLDVILVDTTAEGCMQDGGVNSYAPASGVVVLLGLPLMSAVMPTGVPILSTAGLDGEKSPPIGFTKIGSASTELISPLVAVCQSARVI